MFKNYKNYYTNNKKNIVNATKILIHNETFSPDSDGKKNTNIVRNDIPTHGNTKFTV